MMSLGWKEIAVIVVVAIALILFVRMRDTTG